MTFVEVLVATLAVWRVTHLLAREDGPWGVVARLRRGAGDGFWGELMDCFLCLSVWLALPMAFLVGAGPVEWLMLWPGLSGGAVLLERATTRETEAVAPESGVAEWTEDPAPGLPAQDGFPRNEGGVP